MEWAIVAAIVAALAAVGLGAGLTAWGFGFEVDSLRGEIARLQASLKEAEANGKRANEASGIVVDTERRIADATGAAGTVGSDPVAGLRGLLRAGDPGQPPQPPPGPPVRHLS